MTSDFPRILTADQAAEMLHLASGRVGGVAPMRAQSPSLFDAGAEQAAVKGMARDGASGGTP